MDPDSTNRPIYALLVSEDPINQHEGFIPSNYLHVPDLRATARSGLQLG